MHQEVHGERSGASAASWAPGAALSSSAAGLTLFSWSLCPRQEASVMKMPILQMRRLRLKEEGGHHTANTWQILCSSPGV